MVNRFYQTHSSLFSLSCKIPFRFKFVNSAFFCNQNLRIFEQEEKSGISLVILFKIAKIIAKFGNLLMSRDEKYLISQEQILHYLGLKVNIQIDCTIDLRHK